MVIIALYLNSLSLADITPGNIAGDKTIAAVIAALDPELRSIAEDAGQALILPSISSAGGKLADFLALQFHDDFYSQNLSTELKCEHAANSIKLHMKKGTAAAVIEALRQLDISAEFVPWWETGDIPYTFRLRAVIAGDYYRTAGRDSLVANIRRAVETAKSARSFLAGLETSLHEDGAYILHNHLPALKSGASYTRIQKPPVPDKIIHPAKIFPVTSGSSRTLLQRERNAVKLLRPGFASHSTFSICLWEGNYTLNDLLLRFEKRIFDRIDSYEKNMLGKFDALSKDMNMRFDAVDEALKWGGDDEEL